MKSKKEEKVVSYGFLIIGALAAKLASSGDDVVWFLPFVTGKRRLVNSFLYILTLEVIVGLAAIIAWLGIAGIERMDVSGLSSAQLLNLIAGVFLAGYAVYLYWQSRKAEDDTEDADNSVIVIAFLGSLDELSYFPGLMIGGTFSPLQLAIGTALAGLTIIGICLGAGKLQILVTVISKVPLWIIIGVIAIWTLLEAVL